MKDKKAQIFWIWLVLLTVIMCSAVIMIYLKQQDNISSSLVSPLKVLEERDKLEIFELREGIIVDEVYEELISSEKNYGVGEFEKKFREEFFTKINTEPRMKDYILEDLYIEGKKASLNEEEYKLFIENYLYPEKKTILKDDTFTFTRAKIAKVSELDNGDVTKIKYPVTFNFEFEKEYTKNKNKEVIA